MNTLKEKGGRQLKLRAIDLLFDTLEDKARDILVEIREEEKDVPVLSRIDKCLNLIEGNALSPAYKG
ncbi:MAG: hypothetical protein N2745_06465 [Syntrophorhabdaceae bacterium]|nr:hypothetical protein [Syntrophorhabdaceae bacterium]